MKVLLIEDRYERQFRALHQAGITLESYAFLHNATLDEYEAIYQALKEDHFDVSAYDFIISHKSAYAEDNSTIIERLKSICKEADIPLVLFSGGQDSTYHDRASHYAEISSKSLYSQNLKLFLDDIQSRKETNIDILLYGKLWKQNIALNTLQKLNIFIETHKEEHLFFKRFVSQFAEDLHYLKSCDIEIEMPHTDEKHIEKAEIATLAKKLKSKIQRMIDA
jgi:hypothetical protein